MKAILEHKFGIPPNICHQALNGEEALNMVRKDIMVMKEYTGLDET